MGTRLGPGHIALLARRPESPSVSGLSSTRVVVLTTGDELIEPGRALALGRFTTATQHGLSAAIRSWGRSRVSSNPPETTQTPTGNTIVGNGCDLVITSGGVSVGDFDYVKSPDRSSARSGFWRIRMRPGKPLTFGRLSPRGGSKRVLLLGLPGNPTSTMVTFYVFARPLIRKIMGISDPVPVPLTALRYALTTAAAGDLLSGHPLSSRGPSAGAVGRRTGLVDGSCPWRGRRRSPACRLMSSNLSRGSPSTYSRSMGGARRRSAQARLAA